MRIIFLCRDRLTADDCVGTGYLPISAISGQGDDGKKAAWIGLSAGESLALELQQQSKKEKETCKPKTTIPPPSLGYVKCTHAKLSSSQDLKTEDRDSNGKLQFFLLFIR